MDELSYNRGCLEVYFSKTSSAISKLFKGIFVENERSYNTISGEFFFKDQQSKCFGGIIFKEQQSYNHGFLKDFVKDHQNCNHGTFLQRQADQKNCSLFFKSLIFRGKFSRTSRSIVEDIFFKDQHRYNREF